MQSEINVVRSHRTEIQVYIKMYYESKLRRSIDEAMNGRCNGERLKVQMEVARTAYDNESAEVKEKVQARLEELRLLDATGNMALGSGSASDDSEALRV